MKFKYEYLCPVAGVSFPNEDGTTRQSILTDIAKGDKTNEYRFIADLKLVDFVNAQGITEDAIEVWAGNRMVGYVPKKDIPAVKGTPTAVAIVGWYDKADMYTVNLHRHEVPSAKQYAYWKSICRKNNWQEDILYTRQDYTDAISRYEKGITA